MAVNDANTDSPTATRSSNAAAGLVQQAQRWRLTEFVRVDNLFDRNYVGSVIVNEGNARYFEPAPRRNMTVGLSPAIFSSGNTSIFHRRRPKP